MLCCHHRLALHSLGSACNSVVPVCVLPWAGWGGGKISDRQQWRERGRLGGDSEAAAEGVRKAGRGFSSEGHLIQLVACTTFLSSSASGLTSIFCLSVLPSHQLPPSRGPCPPVHGKHSCTPYLRTGGRAPQVGPRFLLPQSPLRVSGIT